VFFNSGSGWFPCKPPTPKKEHREKAPNLHGTNTSNMKNRNNCYKRLFRTFLWNTHYREFYKVA
jgi:hypothetical protein